MEGREEGSRRLTAREQDAASGHRTPPPWATDAPGPPPLSGGAPGGNGPRNPPTAAAALSAPALPTPSPLITWMTQKGLIPILLYLALFSNARFFLPETSGSLSFLLAALMAATPILFLKATAELLASRLGLAITFKPLANLALAGAASLMSLALIETSLQTAARIQKSDDRSAFLASVAMPPQWARRPVEIPGAAPAYYWHGALHVHNRDGMRLVGEFPPKKPDRFRIVVVGDSLTYGYGIAAEDTYPALLQRRLNTTFRVEVLNLGVSGAQSEDVFNILRRFLPILDPELVIYGVCLNDFLPSGVGEYRNNRAYAVPLPYKDHFIRNTLTGRFLEKRYDALLMKMGLRVDFLTDILRDFDGYQTRFARDIKAMNAYVQEEGLPPIFAMILDQYPNTKAKKYDVVLAAERHLSDGGLRVIPSDYIKRHDGARDWYVSAWEGHPNEKANRVFAEEILKVVRDVPELRKFRR